MEDEVVADWLGFAIGFQAACLPRPERYPACLPLRDAKAALVPGSAGVVGGAY